MKIGKSKKNSNTGVFNKPAANHTKKIVGICLIVALTSALILWVYFMGRKAEETVQVVMLAQSVYKNETITESMLKPYDMLKGEFDKYAVTDSNGAQRRRILLWSEKDMIINSFAAYPLQQETYAEYRDFVKSRIDNSDSVMYSFPGKEVIPLEIGSAELQAFKTFLQPGDRLNIEAIFTQKEKVQEDDGFGGTNTNNVDVYKNETVFRDIMIADLLNSSGESILDIYAGYNDMTVWEQAQLDVSQSFKDSTEPRTLLVALTPEEKDRYYYYLSKPSIEFKASMPQRVE